MELLDLRVNHMVEPLGTGPTVYFSWKLKSGLPGTVQKGYRICLRAEHGPVLYDTGWKDTDKAAYIPYDGPALESRTRYIWNLTVRDNHGETAQSKSFFETALLHASDWQAVWMANPRPPIPRTKGFGNQPPATLFRRKFTLNGSCCRARLYATCLGTYQLTVNGIAPDDRVFAPEHTAYRKYLCYQTYDVTGLLVSGENVIGMEVGDGWYCCPQTRPPIDGLKPDHAVFFQLEVMDGDGNRTTVCSDGDVKVSEGPVRFADLYDGMCYDAAMEKPGWDKAGYSDQAWLNAKKLSQDLSVLRPQLGAPVRPVRKLPAVRIYTSPKGEMIVDFGQVITGVVQVRVNLPAGDKLTLEHFEQPDKDGSYYNSVQSEMGITEQKDVYISNGQLSLWTPRFTFHGFRYVRVAGMDRTCLEDFTAIVLATDMENAGSFACSDERLNRLYENTRWSQRGNMLSIPTDCPQREKAGWTGDVLIYARTALLNEDVTPFLTRWLENVACDQRENGSIPFTVPDTSIYHYNGLKMGEATGCGGPVTSSGWGDAAVWVPWEMYEITGNDAILESQYASMKAWCDYVISRAKIRKPGSTLPDEIEQYLWNTGFQFGEWLIPSQAGEPQEKIFETMSKSGAYTAPIFGWRSCELLARTAFHLGKSEDAAYYRTVADRMKLAIQNGVIDPQGNMPEDRMGAYVLPIAFDLVPAQFRKQFKDRLVASVERNGGCLDTGFLATPFLLDALCKIGRLDLAYGILFQEKIPSWLGEVKAGATTIWESWIMFEESGTPKNMSFNHYAFGCVDEWMFRKIGGMSQIGKGYKHLVFAPEPHESLTWASRSFLTEQGTASCVWKKEQGQFRIDVEIPCNSDAIVVLPDGQIHEVGSGSYQFRCAI